MKKTDYIGWKNRQTWNCSLWIMNDECLYKAAVEFMKQRQIKIQRCAEMNSPRYAALKYNNPYCGFIRAMGLKNARTPDNIAWLSARLCYLELNAMMLELIAHKQGA